MQLKREHRPKIERSKEGFSERSRGQTHPYEGAEVEQDIKVLARTSRPGHPGQGIMSWTGRPGQDIMSWMGHPGQDVLDGPSWTGHPGQDIIDVLAWTSWRGRPGQDMTSWMGRPGQDFNVLSYFCPFVHPPNGQSTLTNYFATNKGAINFFSHFPSLHCKSFSLQLTLGCAALAQNLIPIVCSASCKN